VSDAPEPLAPPFPAFQKVDLAAWDRREHFSIYEGWDFPYINIGVEIDVTRLLTFSRSRGLSSYLALVHVAHQTARDLVNFRYRIVDGVPVLLDDMCLSFTYMPEGSELFINVCMAWQDDLCAFHDEARVRALAQGDDVGVAALRGRWDMIRYSGLPWLQYTHVVRTIARSGVDSAPKMTWGKYFERDGRMLVTFSVQVHHGLMDGYHLGTFYERLQRNIDQLA